MSRIRHNKLELEAIYGDVAEYLVRLRSHHKVKQMLAVKYNVKPDSVTRWIQEVHARWRAEAPDDPEARENKRAFMRATLNEIAALAMNRQLPLRGEDGKVVRDANGKVTMRVVPDLQHALHAAAQLRAMDGLDAPVKVNANVKHTGKVDGEVEVKGSVEHKGLITEDERRALEGLIKGFPKRG